MQLSLQFPIPSSNLIEPKGLQSHVYQVVLHFRQGQCLQRGTQGASAIHNSLDMFRGAKGVNKQKHSCTALRSERMISSNLKYALHIFERRDCGNTLLLHSICRGTGTPFLHVSSRHRGREMSSGPNQSANENLPIGLRANP